MTEEKTIQLYRILKKYCFLRMSQREIAASENLSTATISRMINNAIEKGYIGFSLNLPVLTVYELEQEIKRKYNLDTVSVAKVEINDRDIIAKDVSLLVADYLNHTIQPGDVVGISWGETLSSVAHWLKPLRVPNVTVVGLNGGVSKNVSNTGSETIIKKFADNYNAQAYAIPLPSIMDTPDIVASVGKDSNIQKIFQLIEKTRIVLFSVGCIRSSSILVKVGYFTEEEYGKLREKGFVGDICSRYFREDGSFVKDDLYNRTIGINLDEIRTKEKRICVVMDPEKSKSLQGALKGGFITNLFLDEITAQKILL